MTGGLDAEWGTPIKILCAKAGPVCACGSYTARARRLPDPPGEQRRVLYAIRCEQCAKTHAFDMLDPGATVDMSQPVPTIPVQTSLF